MKHLCGVLWIPYSALKYETKKNNNNW
jgi:hypothetical protein